MNPIGVPVIGLTGGIASGKSTVERAFKPLGASVFDADHVARDLVEPGQPALNAIVDSFGRGALDTSGRLDRALMRARIFADAEARRALEAILHPAIRCELERLASSITQGYVVLAIPLLVEAGRYEWIDRVLVVDVPRDVQIARVMQRDKASKEQAEAAIAAQASRQARLAIAQDVIVNDGPAERLPGIVSRLHQRYTCL